MQAIPINEVKAKLSHYVAEAAAGQTVYISRFGKPEAMLVPLPKKQPKSWIGALKGQLWISDEAWDQATKQVNQDFEKSLAEDWWHT